jgi:hypothetical protein
MLSNITMRQRKWICQECNLISTEFLTAPSPFDPADTVIGCPHCHAVNAIVQVCEHDGCKQIATCGSPTPEGYIRTCGQHFPGRDHG